MDAAAVWGPRRVPVLAPRRRRWRPAGERTFRIGRRRADGLGASTITHPSTGRAAQSPAPSCFRARLAGSAASDVRLEVVLDDESLPLVLRRGADGGQARVAAFCRNHKLPRGACALLALAALREVRGAAAIAAGLPLVQRRRRRNGLVFLHHEKCAGSRSTLFGPGQEARRRLFRALLRWRRRLLRGRAVLCFDLSNATAASGSAPRRRGHRGPLNWGGPDALPSSNMPAAVSEFGAAPY